MLAPARVVTTRKVLEGDGLAKNLTGGEKMEGLKNGRGGARGRVEKGKGRVEIRNLAMAIAYWKCMELEWTLLKA